MGMSTSVIGFVPPDERWHQMKAIFDSCKLANIEIPKEVRKFFGDMDPDPEGVEVSIPKRAWRDERGCAEGFEVDVESIPNHVKVIRFYNSW